MYNPIISEHFMNPRNIGELQAADETIRIGNPVCGDTIQVHLQYEGDKIADVKYKAYGCATSIATASIFSEYLVGRTLQDVVNTPQDEIDRMLGELEPNQMHCLEILKELFGSVGSVKER